MKGPIRIEKILAISLLSLFLIYSLFEGYKLIAGPQIQVLSPTNWSNTDVDVVTIRGQAKRINTIWLNDRKIFIDKDGMFSEKLLLSPGYTIITLRAEDRFGRETEQKMGLWRNERLEEILFEPPEQATTTTSTTTINN